MHQIKHIGIYILTAALILSVGFNVFSISKFRPKDEIDYRKRYKPYVQMAEALWIERNGGTSDLDLRNPVGITFPNKVCVSLALGRGSIGGVPVYCFRAEDHKLVERYDDVE